MGGATGLNRLGEASSPYLLQHRHNPVHWWPWGEQALAEARDAGKPILLSIGYAACHWCHVMAHESFENPEIAAVMNELFVNIKVDREERPDIDQIYMAALHALGEPGGWPLTMFLTPAAEPFWGGTYFPPTARFGRPGFPDVLRMIARIFREEPQKIEQNRMALRQHLDQPPRAGEAALGRPELDAAQRGLASILDPVKGGVKGAPKFPNAAVLEAVWRGGERLADPALTDLVLTALDKICRGGIRDHVGGGFARYTVDEAWLVPHFEKMLYDNAQILDLLTLAIQATGEPIFRQAAEELVEFVLRDFRTGEGAFASSFDADSEGEEGRYYVWTPQGIADAIGPEDAAFVCRHFDIDEGGNWEGVSIPNRLATPPLDDARWQPIRQKLLAARQRRVPPGRDDKVLADWNGMMIAALAHAGRVLGRRDWIDAARAAFRFVRDSLGRGDRLGHAQRQGRSTFPGFAGDYAQMIRAALRLHEVDGDPRLLDQAARWAEAVERHHSDPETGGYALSADDAADLILRARSALDEATPNANATMSDNLLRLAVLTGEDRWRERADRLLAGLSGEMAANLFGHAALFNALDLRLAGAEIVVTGEGREADGLADAALALPVLSRTVIRAATADALPSAHPMRSGWTAGPTKAFVCLGERCSLPATTPEALTERYREMRSGG